MASQRRNTARIVIAKTALDGHWRGPQLVSHALERAGYEVALVGMKQAGEIIAAAEHEGADLVGLHIGGHVEVAEEIIREIRAALPEMPIFVGGVVPPWAKKRLGSSRLHLLGVALLGVVWFVALFFLFSSL